MQETKHLEVRKKYQDFLLWLFQKINTFPKKQKFILGEEIGKLSLEILKDLIIMQYSPVFQKKAKINGINLKLEIFRSLMRLAWQMKFLSHKSFLYQESKINEVGRMAYGLVFPKSVSKNE
ncbi:MAG: four helix bundle protein [Parcubacteria group bacterium]|nr:four helix bundle protein [Parcubacteria group bacterium]